MSPLVLHVFPSFAAGGAQVRSAAIANRFGPAYRHAIVGLDGDTSCRQKLAPGLDVTFPTVESRKGDVWGNIRRYRRLLRALRPDVLVTSNFGSIEWAMANAMPVATRHVHTEDGFGPEERQRQLPRRVWLRRIFLRRATVMVPSHTLWRIATEIWRFDPHRLRYIPNGVDLARYAPAAGGGKPPWPDAPPGPVIGTVAGLRPEKNLGRLLRAFRLLRDAMPARPGPRLVIVGDGPERARLEQLAASLQIAEAVHFAGQVEQPHLLYPHFDVFALASDTEQMPLSILEAMATGLPAAATDVGDVRGMLAEPNAPFVTPLDEAALAAALGTLLAQPELRRAIGAANRAKAERVFDQEQMFRDHATLLDGARGHSHRNGIVSTFMSFS